MNEGVPQHIGPYRIVRRLGEGGMGVVYAGHDDRLERPVAVKVIREAACDEQARRRFWREARAAAAVSHPNVCHVYEIGEEGSTLFIVMELLEGESLAERLKRGPLRFREAVEVASAILAALQALHDRDLVHRDLKPSNVFLTPHGVKLLDFGLARPVHETPRDATRTEVTQQGAVMGTPRYMSPEQLEGRSVDGRTDLFAAGAILFEMLAGRPVFAGSTMMEVYHATLYEPAPALTGSPAIAALDRVVRRALAKTPAERPSSAAAMAEALRSALAAEDTGAVARPVALTRLIVLPFRILRSDTDTDFLAFSLPDAITGSLSELDALVVRSSLTASRFAPEALDFQRLAVEAEVDTALTGTLLRAGDRLRVVTQLVEVPGGALVWSQTSEVTLKDIFQLQDELVTRIVQSLAVPLTAREHRLLKQDVPATASAYELYLRANQLGTVVQTWDLARQLYEQCLAQDPRYAPAWARLGRIYRLMAKYLTTDVAHNITRAETAFQRALDLNPDLPLAHSLYAQFEVEAGRPRSAMVRLLTLARTKTHDAVLYAGLCHVLRYCGLLEASLAADRKAKALDPAARTGVCYTHFMLGDYERAEATEEDEIRFMRGYTLAAAGQVAEAVAYYRSLEGQWEGHNRDIFVSQRAALEGDVGTCLQAVERLRTTGFKDPEGLYFVVRVLSSVGATDQALELLGQIVDRGFHCLVPLVRDPWLLPLRGRPEYAGILGRAEALHREAAAAFEAEGGPEALAEDVAGAA